MASGYTRVYSKVTGNTIRAADFNNEFQLIDDAFSEVSGHKHDGSTNEGPYISLISDTNKYTCVEIDSDNAEIDFNTNVSSAKVRQLVLTDGALLPDTDDDIDLGSTTKEFKNLYIDGEANIDLLKATSVGANLTPSSDDLYSLGGAGLRWKYLYAENIDVAKEMYVGATVYWLAEGDSLGARLKGVMGPASGTPPTGTNIAQVYGEWFGNNVAEINFQTGSVLEQSGRIQFVTYSASATLKQALLLDQNGKSWMLDVNISTPSVPSSASASGTAGDIAWDANYVYVCVSNNTWKRAALSTW